MLHEFVKLEGLVSAGVQVECFIHFGEPTLPQKAYQLILLEDWPVNLMSIRVWTPISGPWLSEATFPPH